MINPKLLREGEFIEEHGGAYIIRSSFFSVSHSIDEIIDFVTTKQDESILRPIQALTTKY